MATAPKANLPKLTQSLDCDVVIVGGGIVGLTAALAVSKQGRSPVVLEALQIGRQVTGRSTAKITTQHSLIYRYLVDHAGIDIARAYGEANRTGAQQIETWIREHSIDCDYERRAAYVYTCDPARREELESEREAALAVGLDAQVLERAPLPFDTAGALRFPDQAQFNPASYLVGLAGAVQAAGGRLFEQSRVRKIEEGKRWRVETDQGAVDAKHIVVATNMTVKSPVGYSHRTQPRSHTAIAFRLDDSAAIDGMFIGAEEPTHSIRTGRDSDGALLIVLGPHFNTGQDGNVAQRFRDLEAWARKNLPAGAVVWRWCNEDYDTPDRMPYVGQPAPDEAPGFHIATGFNAWGISNGTAAGLLIATDIMEGRRLWGSLFAPTRPYPEDFHQSGDTQSSVERADQIAAGQGGVIRHGDEKLAVWRDLDGELHVMSASCTHKGCTVTWNNADLTWDCPCHGSIFQADGAVIHGPARQPLTKRE